MVRTILIAGALACTPMAALADITPYSLPDPAPTPGYGGRVGTPGVRANDTASMSLMMFDSQDRSASVNMGGEFSVTRGPSFTNIGANRNGGGNVLSSWDEVVQGSTVYVNAMFKTSDGSMFMPATARVNGSPAFFWTWHFGVTDPVNYQPWVTQVQLLSARIYFSDNGGASFNSFSNISGLGGSFLTGRDSGNYLASIGDGTNFILLQYQISVVPAPAGLGVLAGAGLMAARRRRR
jgi:hypothetical protein